MNISRQLMSVILGLTLLALSAAAQRKDANSSSDDVKGTLEKLFTAWSDLDPAKAAPFYAKDADLTFFDIAPMKYNG
jgi:hypothetical protein